MSATRNDKRNGALVVLDDLGERRFVAMLLRSIGFTETVHVDSYEKACDLLLTVPFDLVLTDWAVNGEPMHAFLRKVRDFPTTDRSAVPFIMFTSRASQADVSRARDWVSTPI
jgi:DNA-binding response OmpR family regulator